MKDADKADFEVVGSITRWSPDRAGKVVRFSVEARGMRKKIVDLKFFGALPGYTRGDRVRVVGELSAEKLPDYKETGRNGQVYDKWVPMLVAMRVEALDKAQGMIPGAANDNAREPRRAANGDDDIPF